MRLNKLCLLFFCLTFCIPGSLTYSNDVIPYNIMRLVCDRDDGNNSTSNMQMLIIDKNHNQRKKIIRSFRMKQAKDYFSLLFFLSPADVKGSGFLSCDYEAKSKEDDQWLYLPALKKVKRIASKDKSSSFMGSDFSYSDFTKKRLDDYDYTFYRENHEIVVHDKPCWVIKSIPKTKEIINETGYTKSILFICKENNLMLRGVFYLKDGKTTKYFDVKKIEKIDGIWTETEIHMTRKRNGKIIHKTILSLENIKYNQELVNENLFTTRNLEKGL